MDRVAPDALSDFGRVVLEKVGCDTDEATLVAESLVHADLRGVHSHGMMRLPLYTESVEAGGIVPNAPIERVVDGPVTVVLDAGSGFGQSAMREAVRVAAELAGGSGMGGVGVRNSTHFGAGSVWVRMLAEQGLIGMLLSNSGPCMAPYGSAEPILGANPVAISIPSFEEPPIILDMSVTAVAYGRVAVAHAERKPIPSDWAISRDGRPTTDAREALKGALLPFGGHKGSGLGIVVELLSVALTGAVFSRDITDIFVDRGSRMGTGHLLLALDPGRFGQGEEFARRVAEFAAGVRAARPAEGVEAVQMPGDRELEVEREYREQGIPLPGSVARQLDALAERLGLPAPA